MKHRTIFLVVVVVLAAFFDQLTKNLILKNFNLYESIPILGDFLRFTFVFNENAAFSVAPQKLLPFLTTRFFFLFFNSMAAIVVVVIYFKTTSEEKIKRISFALISGGALGNIIDRIRFGKVVDFIDCDFPDFIMERFPVFNIADSCVTVGIFILLIITILEEKNKKSDSRNKTSN